MHVGWVGTAPDVAAATQGGGRWRQPAHATAAVAWLRLHITRAYTRIQYMYNEYMYNEYTYNEYMHSYSCCCAASAGFCTALQRLMYAGSAVAVSRPARCAHHSPPTLATFSACEATLEASESKSVVVLTVSQEELVFDWCSVIQIGARSEALSFTSDDFSVL